ncbi:kinase RLK-Pelle-DLSV family [Populus alba x Populus x berolinensis]|uniref:Kinase RLK-Pelle-DLSV family n=1 Tax=Populus alba x Populus x berolinensis TaxID=444605 RepID=A0AAD6QJ02_9ROSI|nr:kinase RLK-Pelle-DLSV family [Populus alba x Populus x berolinensis]
MQPKISDFGLARLFSGSQTQGNTKRIAGESGYRAPEYAKKGHFSTKSDVYSFGILVLEIVTGQKISSFRNSINLQSCVSMLAWRHWTNGKALELADPTLGGQRPENEILKCIHIGLLCVQEAGC